MAVAATAALVSSPIVLGLTAFVTDIQTWLTANATGVIKTAYTSDSNYIAILEVPPTP